LSLLHKREKLRMSEKKKPVITKNFLKNLSRGGVKSVPLFGNLIDQMIYGTLDGESAKKESEKLHSALSSISAKLEGQEIYFVAILNTLLQEVIFREEIACQITEISEALKDPDKSPISKRLENALARMIVHNLPYRSIGDLFKGREDMVEKLRSALGAGKTAAITQVHAIHGLGGVGKTRLAVEYAWRALEKGQYWGVFFAVSDTKANLNTNLANLAGLLNLPEKNSKEQPVIVEAVLRELERRTDWLIIFDNVDSDESAERLREEIIPRLSAGDVLMTSRRSNWPDDIADLPIDKLSEPDAIAYIIEKTESKRSKSAKDGELVKKVACELDCLPVALEQAGGYINQRRIGFNTYLKELNESRKKVLSWYSKEHIKYRVAVLSTWQTTEEHLKPRERAILRLASFLAPEAIPVELFESNPKRIKDAAALIAKETSSGSKLAAAKGEVAVRDLLANLAGWSMITLTEDSFTIHRLVQDSIRLSIPKNRRKAWARLAARLVDDHIPSEPPVRSLDLWKAIQSHVAAVSGQADRSGIGEPTTRLMNGLGLYLNTRARFGEAEPLMRRALAIDEKSLGKDHPNVATDLNNLALLLADTNRLAEAEPLMRRALEIDEKSFGKDHPNVATYLNNLALLLKDTNRLAEAEPLMRRVLEIDEKALGENHADVARDVSSLAQLLQDTNRLKEAEPLMRRALQIDEKSFGKDHPTVAIRLNNLAALLADTNRLAEAEPLMRQALEIDEKSFGKDHPNVARDVSNLALLLKAANRMAEAEPLMRRALAIDEKSFGRDHPNVAIRLNNVAQLLRATNRLEEAEPLMRRALEIDQKSFGKDHPNVARDLNNLAELFRATNRLNKAEPMHRRALQIDENSFGKEHPTVAADLNNLALLLEAVNRLAEAEPLVRRALVIDEKSFGKEHPNVARDLNNLALLLKATNRLAEAEPLMRRALAIDEKSFGKDHPHVARDVNNLAALLQDRDRLAEAEPLMRRALAIDEKSFGKDHPDVAIDLNNLAMLLKATNRLAEAEPLMRRALAIDEKSFGKDHSDVAIDLNNLAMLLEDTGRVAEAGPMYRRALEIFEKSLGPDHPNTQKARENLELMK